MLNILHTDGVIRLCKLLDRRDVIALLALIFQRLFYGIPQLIGQNTPFLLVMTTLAADTPHTDSKDKQASESSEARQQAYHHVIAVLFLINDFILKANKEYPITFWNIRKKTINMY